MSQFLTSQLNKLSKRFISIRYFSQKKKWVHICRTIKVLFFLKRRKNIPHINISKNKINNSDIVFDKFPTFKIVGGCTIHRRGESKQPRCKYGRRRPLRSIISNLHSDSLFDRWALNPIADKYNRAGMLETCGRGELEFCEAIFARGLINVHWDVMTRRG